MSRGRRAPGRPGPRAKVLRSEVLSADLTQVVVDVARPDRLLHSILVQVLEQIFPRQRLAPAHDPRESPVAQRNGVDLPALAAEFELHGRAGYLDVVVQQRREPE